MSLALIYGGAGQLGGFVVRAFKSAGWKVLSADIRASEAADFSVLLKSAPAEDAQQILSKVASVGKDGKVDAIVVVAGGFAMGSVADDSIFDTLNRMWNYNVVSSFSAAHVAAKSLRPGGLLVLTGAEGALRPTPFFASYGASKAATHQLLSSLASPQCGLPNDATAIAILPVMLDTPQNRADMPGANFNDWTPLDELAQKLVSWACGNDRPKSGSKVIIQTQDKQTSYTVHD